MTPTRIRDGVGRTHTIDADDPTSEFILLRCGRGPTSAVGFDLDTGEWVGGLALECAEGAA